MKSPLPNLFFWTAFSVLAAGLFYFVDSLSEATEKLETLKALEKERRSEVAESQKKYNWQEAYKTRMLEDEFFFREARERLNYAAPGEIIIKVK